MVLRAADEREDNTYTFVHHEFDAVGYERFLLLEESQPPPAGGLRAISPTHAPLLPSVDENADAEKEATQTI